MTPYKIIILSILFAFVGPTFGQDSAQVYLNDHAVSLVTNGEFKKLHKHFDQKFQKKIKPIQLKLIWASLHKSLGAYDHHEKYTASSKDDAYVFVTPLFFEKGSLNLQITISNNLITGLWFMPREYAPNPAYAGKTYGKEQLKIDAGEFELPAEVLLPRDCDQCPLVVLVHGSGPSDMDESIGPAKPFKDLAMGLALEGIATLRYDKRSYVAKKGFGPKDDFTIQEETVLDALKAVQKAKGLSYIDTNMIFVAGHSLGAYAAPLIASQDSSIRGFIMLAGPERPLYDIIPDQMQYIFGLDGEISRKERRMLKKLDKGVVQLRNLKEKKPKKLKGQVTYWPLPFYVDLIDYSPAATIKKSGEPFLILQGEFDYQVSYEKEFLLLKSKLEGTTNIQFNSYPNLDHLFMQTDDFSEPMDYMEPRNVDSRVIKDIATWVNGFE